MARQLRVEYEGAWYHIMNRGAARQAVFLTDEHCEIFLQLLLEIHRRYQVEIHAYCLMNNHYHLLIRTPLANLSKAMRHLNGIYTQRFNVLQKRDGSIFRGRFKSILVDSENYLLRVSRYIHLNPVKAGFVKKAEEFPWSSYTYYINSKTAPDWLFCDETLNRFSKRLRCKQYQLFVEEGVDNETDTFYKKVERIPILGVDALTKTISEKYLKDQPNDKEIPQQNYVLQKHLPRIEEVFQMVADSFDQDVETLHMTLCRQKNIAKSAAIYLSMEFSHATQTEIADYLGDITYSGVAKNYIRFRELMGADQNLTKQVDQILSNLENSVLMSDVKT